jgi:hypothetical protein
MTRAWTTWTKEVACGVSLVGKNELYLGGSDYKYVLKQRSGIAKRNADDYMDETIFVNTAADAHGTTTDSSGNTVTTITLPKKAMGPRLGAFDASKHGVYWEHKKDIRAGFLVEALGETRGYNFRGKVASVALAVTEDSDGHTATTATLTMKTNMNITGNIDGVNIYIPIDSVIKFGPHNMGVSEVPKQFTYATITMQSGTALTNELGFYSDAVPVSEWVGEIALDNPLGWGGGAWGTSAWGTEESLAVVPLVSPVPRQHQRCRELTLMYRHRVAGEEFHIESVSFRVKAYKGKLTRIPT